MDSDFSLPSGCSEELVPCILDKAHHWLFVPILNNLNTEREEVGFHLTMKSDILMSHIHISDLSETVWFSK